MQRKQMDNPLKKRWLSSMLICNVLNLSKIKVDKCTIILYLPVDLDDDFRFEFPHIDEVCYSELRVVEKVMERTYKMQVFG